MSAGARPARTAAAGCGRLAEGDSPVAGPETRVEPDLPWGASPLDGEGDLVAAESSEPACPGSAVATTGPPTMTPMPKAAASAPTLPTKVAYPECAFIGTSLNAVSQCRRAQDAAAAQSCDLRHINLGFGQRQNRYGRKGRRRMGRLPAARLRGGRTRSGESLGEFNSGAVVGALQTRCLVGPSRARPGRLDLGSTPCRWLGCHEHGEAPRTFRARKHTHSS